MSEVVMSAVLRAETLQRFIDAQRELVHESRFHFDDDGIHIRAVEPANVAMIFADLSASAFESYDSPGKATVGVSLDALDDHLGVADSDDLVKLELDMETRTLNLGIRHIDQSVRLIDPDSMRQEPDKKDLGLPNEFTVEGKYLDEGLTVAEIVTDHIKIEGNPDDGNVRLVGPGDISNNQTTVTLGHDEVIDAKVKEPVMSMFSLDYFEDLVAPIPDDAEVRVQFGDEFPAILEWETSEGHQQVEQMIAPRIQSD